MRRSAVAIHRAVGATANAIDFSREGDFSSRGRSPCCPPLEALPAPHAAAPLAPPRRPAAGQSYFRALKSALEHAETMSFPVDVADRARCAWAHRPAPAGFRTSLRCKRRWMLGAPGRIGLWPPDRDLAPPDSRAGFSRRLRRERRGGEFSSARGAAARMCAAAACLGLSSGAVRGGA